MHEIVDKIYLHSPLMMQNALVSLLGVYLHWRRYGGNSKKHARKLMKSQWLSADNIDEMQAAKLRELINHAYSTVPYYKRVFKNAGLNPDIIQKITDLGKVPVLDKEQIRNRPRELCSSQFKEGRGTFVLHTSGTTGKPLSIYCDTESRRRNYAFFTRLRTWNRIQGRSKRVTFGGRVIMKANSGSKIFWRYDVMANNWIFSSYHMSEENLEHYYSKLVKIQPKEIVSYPSSLFVMAKYMKRNSLRGLRPRSIMTSGETLLDDQREIIEEQFECKVTDQFGSAEMSHFISQCEHGSYHAHPEYGIIEVVDSEGNPVDVAKEGELVCTSFINYMMPLIRYRIGDRVIMSDEKCACGRHFQTFSKITGRMDDILVTPDGKPLVRFSPAVKAVKGIYETQIIQTRKDTLAVKVVPSPEFTESELTKLESELTKRTGKSMKIEIEIVDEIPRGRNGKFRTVISRI